jgi:hypothetical protein
MWAWLDGYVMIAYRLEEVQDVLRARGSPQSQEPMVGAPKRSPTADGDEAGVAIFGEDHGVGAPPSASGAPAEHFAVGNQNPLMGTHRRWCLRYAAFRW